MPLFNQFLLLIVIFFFQMRVAFPIDIAITFDDLPSHENTPPGVTRLDIAKQILAALKKHHITSIYGFINEQSIGENQDNYNVLEAWTDQGQLLGNHTSSHLDVNRVGIMTFIADIEANEPILKQLMGIKNYKYFRYPYLSEGETKNKRDKARQYLFENDYKIAEVTTDFLDYEWNDPYIRCLELDDQKSIQWLKKTYIEQSLNAITISHELSTFLFNRDIKNILLLHFGAFDALMLDELIAAYEKNNVHFIGLPEALTDSAYQLNPNVLMKRPYTFLNQLRASLGAENPGLVQELYNSLPEAQLERLCRKEGEPIAAPHRVLRVL